MTCDVYCNIDRIDGHISVGYVKGYFIKVGVMSDPTDFNTFEEVTVLSPQTTTDWEQFFVSFGSYTGTGT